MLKYRGAQRLVLQLALACLPPGLTFGVTLLLLLGDFRCPGVVLPGPLSGDTVEVCLLPVLGDEGAGSTADECQMHG
jgi:hypothetical protein